jgi:prophage DNA circulation protein
MAWEESLMDASFKGVGFSCMRTRDGAQRDVQRHQYPYVNGEDTEDLGRDGIQSDMLVVFWGPDYEKKLQELVAVLEEPGPGELIHPIYGSIPLAQLLDYTIDHDADNTDSCRVSLQFLHTKPGSPFFVRSLPAQQAAVSRQYKDDGIGAGVEAWAKRVKDMTSLSGITGRLNSMRSTMSRVLSAIRSVTNGTSTVLDLIDFPRAFASDLSSGLSGLIDLRGFSRESRVSDWKSVKSVFNDVVLLPVSVSNGDLPASFAGGGVASAPVAPTPGGGQVDATRPIPIASEDLKPIEAVVKVQVAGELIETAGDILGQEAERPTLSPADIETIVNDVRDAVQTAIDAHREIYPIDESRPIAEPLKSAALAIQEIGAAIIETRPPLGRHTVAAPTNLHLLAFHLYGDYRRAEELSRLNPRLRNPNDLQVGDIINAYQR